MINYIQAYFVAFGSMVVLDAVWLGLVAPKFYKKYIGFIMTDTPNWLAAGVFYLIYALGITFFVVYPGWSNSFSLVKVGLYGALLGLVCYGTYDLTNHATLKNWPLTVTLVDIAWGVIITSLVSITAVYILNLFIK